MSDDSSISFDGAAILYAQIVEDTTLFVLLNEASNDDTSRHHHSLVACHHSDDGATTPQQWTTKVVHTFSSDRHVFEPKHFTACGRPGRRVIVVFSQDEKSWQILDLDSQTQAAKMSD
jgi:hypothetical protein